MKRTIRENLQVFAMLFCCYLLNSTMAYATTYEVGPGKPYSSILQTPTHNLQAGDSIKVFYQAIPYSEKFLLHGIGTANNPIVLIGIPDVNGNRPVLEGNNALSSTAYNYFNEDRQLLLIGQYNVFQSDYVIVDGFEIRGANNLNSYTNDVGNNAGYAANACGIRVSWGKNITIRNCEIHSNGNAIQNGDGVDQNLLIEYCDIHENGLCSWSNSYIHNFYFNSGSNSTVTVQYCHVGELLSNGQQVKSRAQNTVIRYNWIEGGRNSSLDLVEDVDSSYFYVSDAYVYGNVIIKPDSSNNSRIVHFGADNPGQFRLGTCYFFNNTCIIKDRRTWGSRRIFQFSDDSSRVVADNNIFYKSDAITYDLLSGVNNLSGSNNWLSTNIALAGPFTNSIVGVEPGFIDTLTENYQLKCSSPCYNALATYNYPGNHQLSNQYVKHMQNIPRVQYGNLDLGAFETPPSPAINLGNDTTINASSSITLDAGAGHAAYAWSTGATTQTINVASPPLPAGNHTFIVQVTDQNGCVNSDTILVTILPALGVEERTLPTVSVYPNPMSDVLTIDGTNLNTPTVLHLMNALGEIVMSKTVQPNTNIHLNTTELATGLYFIRIGNKTIKVVKQNL
jgi:hypothetical protein